MTHDSLVHRGLGYRDPRRRGLMSNSLQIKRYIYFSFHYGRDIRRVQQVKNSWLVKGSYEAAGYFDGSLEELAKKESDLAVKRAINKGMKGSSVLCVLNGAETATRPWVVYEILKALEMNKGIMVVNIHNVNDPINGIDRKGVAPGSYAALNCLDRNKNALPYCYSSGNWVPFNRIESFPQDSSPYIERGTFSSLAEKFPIYDWVNDAGTNNLAAWADAEAKAVKR